MTLFSNEIDKSVQKPPMVEFERIKKELTAKVTAAKKSGDKAAVAHARQDLFDHLKLLDKYQEAARNQLDIFSV